MVRGLVFGVWERIREGGEIPRLRTAIGGRVGSAVLRSIRLGTGGLRQEWFARRGGSLTMHRQGSGEIS